MCTLALVLVLVHLLVHKKKEVLRMHICKNLFKSTARGVALEFDFVKIPTSLPPFFLVFLLLLRLVLF